MTNDQLSVQPDEAGAAQIMYDISRGHLVDGPLPEALRSYEGAPVESGLSLQLAVLDRWIAAGETIGGYKIGWTSRGARDRGGVGFRPFGYILASRMLASGSVVHRADVPNCVIEPEICVTMGRRLGAEKVSVEEARDAVASVSASFEVISARTPEGVAMPCRIGNGLNNWGLVYGPEHTPDVALDAITVDLLRDGEPAGSSGSGPDVVDDPYLSLARVAVLLHRYGRALEPGQRILTGSILPGAKTEGASRYEASFGPLGSVAVEFD